MRRSVIEATDENVREALKEDKAGRASEMVSFCKIIGSVGDSLAVFHLDCRSGRSK